MYFAQDIIRQKYVFLKRNVAPIGGVGVTLSYMCPNATASRLKTTRSSTGRMPNKDAAKALAAAQDNNCRPPEPPRFLHSATCNLGFVPRPSKCPQLNETAGLVRPTSCDLARARAPCESTAFGVGVVPSQWMGDTRVVPNCTPPNRGSHQRTPADDHHKIKCCNVQVAHHDFGRDPPSCFSAHAATRTFQRKSLIIFLFSRAKDM